MPTDPLKILNELGEAGWEAMSVDSIAAYRLCNPDDDVASEVAVLFKRSRV